MSYRNSSYYVDHFKLMSPDEAYVLVMHNMKRPGYAKELVCAKVAFDEVYNFEVIDGVKKRKSVITEFISPEERRVKELEKRAIELQAQIDEKQKIIAAPVQVAAFEPMIENDVPIATAGAIRMNKDEYKEFFAQQMGYANSVGMSIKEKQAFGRAWKKYEAGE